MTLKKASCIFAVAAVGLLLGGAVYFAQERNESPELPVIVEEGSKIIAKDTLFLFPDSFSTYFEKKVECSQYDLTKYTCGKRAGWIKETVAMQTNQEGTYSFTLNSKEIKLEGYAAYTRIVMDIYTPAYIDDPYSVCDKSFMLNNKPYFSEPREERFTVKVENLSVNIESSTQTKKEASQQPGTLSVKDLTDGYDYKSLPQ